MYFLTEEEKRFVVRRLLPDSRRSEVHPDLRGWNWAQPPLSPIYETRLGIFEIAGQYCATGRDIYLRRVQGVKARANLPMVEGGLLHGVVAGLILEAKRTVYREGVDCVEALLELKQTGLNGSGDWRGLSEESRTTIQEKADRLWRFEHQRIVVRVQEILAQQPYVGPDSLVALALPVTVEQKLDGRFLGLSSHLSADAYAFTEPMMFDIKFGERKPFHRLGTAGYALVMESIHEYPINLGCIVYVRFKGKRLLLERDFHQIDDELRQWFVDARDERMRLVEEEVDPGLAGECYDTCPYWRECHPG